MKDSMALRRIKRLTFLFLGNARRLLWSALPSIIFVLIGAYIGSSATEERIHNDCKFTLSFRIGTTGYICEIGK